VLVKASRLYRLAFFVVDAREQIALSGLFSMFNKAVLPDFDFVGEKPLL
jgi:hypothetical protein